MFFKKRIKLVSAQLLDDLGERCAIECSGITLANSPFLRSLGQGYAELSHAQKIAIDFETRIFCLTTMMMTVAVRLAERRFEYGSADRIIGAFSNSSFGQLLSSNEVHFLKSDGSQEHFVSLLLMIQEDRDMWFQIVGMTISKHSEIYKRIALGERGSDAFSQASTYIVSQITPMCVEATEKSSLKTIAAGVTLDVAILFRACSEFARNLMCRINL